MDKTILHAALNDALTRQLHELAASVQAAQQAATDEEARPENKYDTRALEQSYLAAGQGERIEALRRTLTAAHFWQPPAHLDVAGPGALVEIDDGQPGKGPQWLWLTPFSAAATLVVDGRTVQVVWVGAPLGRALDGKQAGDVATVRVGTGVREVEVVAVG